jgi:small multidrug resistance family-3 protein
MGSTHDAALFMLAGLAEIGGGYLMWLWCRDGRAWPLGVAGRGGLSVLYGIIPTYQPAHFGRVYAAYGGAFVILSVLWGWAIDGSRRIATTGSEPRYACLASES